MLRIWNIQSCDVVMAGSLPSRTNHQRSRTNHAVQDKMDLQSRTNHQRGRPWLQTSFGHYYSFNHHLVTLGVNQRGDPWKILKFFVRGGGQQNWLRVKAFPKTPYIFLTTKNRKLQGITARCDQMVVETVL